MKQTVASLGGDEMEAIGNIINNIAVTHENNGDYRDEEGFLVCGKCHTRKESDIEVSKDWKANGIWRVATPCECRKKEIEAKEKAEERRKFLQEFERIQKNGITDPQYLQFKFENDDMQNAKVSKVCRNYVDEWETMKAENMGILFSGTVGTGKSFYACCIANALIENLVPVCVTNFPRILNKLQGLGQDKQAFIDKLQRYSLLVIDDLGVERDTSYSSEQIFNVIDTRTRSNKPTIITTNLTIQEMEKTTDMQYRRIYDRVLEMCPIRLVMTGQSRRNQNAAEKREKALSLLQGNSDE
ncbi:ATP-binding protein [Anaerovorax sp. IOR16]|uniref:ATP-binding protein n=1 Tax=Anaerovorax sp. IOR16 TaxID=2773458 RepID=UPI0019D0DA81|nr:ATP-binding protein [Anaerovorax sp. IOR16]